MIRIRDRQWRVGRAVVRNPLNKGLIVRSLEPIRCSFRLLATQGKSGWEERRYRFPDPVESLPDRVTRRSGTDSLGLGGLRGSSKDK